MATSYTEPTNHDILCGRGNAACNHAGNQLFVQLVKSLRVEYVASSFLEKKIFARELLSSLENLSPPARFLTMNCSKDDQEKNTIYNEVKEYEVVMKKVKQALREGAPDIKRKIEDGILIPRHVDTKILIAEATNQVYYENNMFEPEPYHYSEDCSDHSSSSSSSPRGNYSPRSNHYYQRSHHRQHSQDGTSSSNSIMAREPVHYNHNIQHEPTPYVSSQEFNHDYREPRPAQHNTSYYEKSLVLSNTNEIDDSYCEEYGAVVHRNGGSQYQQEEELSSSRSIKSLSIRDIENILDGESDIMLRNSFTLSQQSRMPNLPNTHNNVQVPATTAPAGYHQRFLQSFSVPSFPWLENCAKVAQELFKNEPAEDHEHAYYCSPPTQEVDTRENPMPRSISNVDDSCDDATQRFEWRGVW